MLVRDQGACRILMKESIFCVTSRECINPILILTLKKQESHLIHIRAQIWSKKRSNQCMSGD